MTFINELASYDNQRVERNVTDLLWFYDDPAEAVTSARSFLFSLSPDFARQLTSNDHFDSLEILWHLLASFDRSHQTGTGSITSTSATIRNRLLVIGGYGWGKSSLALVAACFLGQPLDEPSYVAARDALDPESGDTPRQLVDKRESQKTKFTICMKGAATNFHMLFITAVAKSRERYRSVFEKSGFEFAVKCEFDGAAAWLRKMRGAVGFSEALAAESIDLNSLIESLDTLRPDALIDADRIFRVYNRLDGPVMPPWSSQANTAEYLTDLVSHLTGTESPFDGVLVIFDEVGLWVEHANENSTAAGVAEYLDFMERSSRFQGKLSVCSFIQFDIESYIGRETAAQNIKHISERLGVRVKYRPDLELVFQKAVRHKGIPADMWRDHGEEIDRFANLLVGTFKRYTQEPWIENRGRVRTVVQRCWPIHPFMVAAACHLRFGQGARVLSLLENQFPRLRERQAENAHGGLTWSVPVDLVDYFKANFENVQEKMLWEQYDHALTSLGCSAADARSLLLKAIFLCHSLKYDIELGDPDDFPEVVANFAGIDVDRTRELLHELSQSHGAAPPVLLLNENSGWYEFFAMDQNPAEAQRALTRLFDQSSAFDLEDDEIGGDFSRLCPVSPEAFTRRRHVEEHSFKSWKQTVLDVGKLTAAYLVDLVKSEVLTDPDPNYRGIHVLVLYSSTKLKPVDGDGSGQAATEVRERCQKALNDAWSQLKSDGCSIPLFVSFPKRAPDELYRSLALLSCARGLPQSEQERIGQGLRLFQENQRAEARRRMTAYRDWNGMEFLLPNAPADVLLASLPSANSPNSARVAALYEAVYSSRPPLKHSELGTSGTKFVKYCHTLMRFLMAPTHDVQGMPREFVNALQSVLVATPGQEMTSWMAVTESNGAYEIQEPQNQYARSCYQAFDKALRAIKDEEKRSLKEIWKTLSVAPFGLDVRSFVLMFGIWYDRHRDSCELILEGESVPASWEAVVQLCERKPDFMKFVIGRPFHVKLRDLAAEAAKLRNILDRLRKWDNSEESATSLVHEIAEARGLARSAPEWNEVNRLCAGLEQAVVTIQNAKAQVASLRREVELNATLENAADFLRRLSEVERPTATSDTLRSTASSCLASLEEGLTDSVTQAIQGPYPSLDVEQYELSRAVDRLRALPLVKVAAAFGVEEANQPQRIIETLLSRLQKAEQDAPIKYRERREQQAAAAAFRHQLDGLMPRELGPLLLAELQHLAQKMDAMERECPPECRAEHEERRRDLGHRITKRREAVRDCLLPFQTPGRSPEQILNALDIAERILPTVEGTKEAELLRNVVAAKASTLDAVKEFRIAANGSSLSQQRQSAVRLEEIEKQLPAEANQAVRAWRIGICEAIDRRETSARREMESLKKRVANVSDAATALTILGEIGQMSSGDLAELFPGESERLKNALATTFAEIAPVQIAEVLRPLPPESRQVVVKRALELLGGPLEP